MGPVFRAHDPAHGRPVAVKLFTLDLPPARAQQLLGEFERLIAAALVHPAVNAPFAAGIVDSSVYLVHEHVEAQSLDVAVREYGPAPPAHAARVAAQLAGALDFAAAVNVVHGALHPRDVLLSATDVQVTGLGVSRALEAVGVTAPVRRPYTAPERAAGAQWDRRADVFSLAALIFELLWARSIDGIGPEIADTLAHIGRGDLGALRSTFARALSHDPAARYPSALAFAEALSEAISVGGGQAVVESQRIVESRPNDERQPIVEGQPSHAADQRASAGPAPPDSLTPLTPMLPLEDAAVVRPTVHELVLGGARPDVEAPAVASGRIETSDRDVDAPTADLELKAAEEARYQDVEASPSIVQPALDTDREPTVLASHVDGRDFVDGRAPDAERRERRYLAGPIAAALVLGIGLGFAGGYGIAPRAGSQSAADTTPAAAAAPITAAPASAPSAGREFTENAVAAPPPSVPATPEASSTAAPAGGRPPIDTKSAIDNRSAISSQSAIGNQQSAISEGRLLVRSTPAGARVVVDGREYGRTPVAVRELAEGPHRVHVVRDGYAPVDRRVTITAERSAQSITVPLERAAAAPTRTTGSTPPPADVGLERFVGTLVVDSRPAGAKVYLDGQLVGSTPLSLRAIRAGEHAMRLEHDGYRRWSGSVRVVAAEQNRVTASLER